MIRKERKARWTYTCERCNVHEASVDQFGAIEHQQRHERSVAHFAAAFGVILDEWQAALTEAFLGVSAAVTEAAEQIQSAFAPLAPPRNIPHDPSLRRDRRKWGGR